MFGLVERFINAKVLELSEDHWFGDQVALEALVRFSDEELKHQALFRLVDAMVGDVLPAGYRFDVDHNAVAHAVLGKTTWAAPACKESARSSAKLVSDRLVGGHFLTPQPPRNVRS